MVLPFDIYMTPPNILVFPTYGRQEVTVLTQNLRCGEIVQVNNQTFAYNVGNIVFYQQGEERILLSTKTNERYNMINENSILFREP